MALFSFSNIKRQCCSSVARKYCSKDWYRLFTAVATAAAAAAGAIASSWDYLLLLQRGDNYSASLSDCLLGDFVT